MTETIGEIAERNGGLLLNARTPGPFKVTSFADGTIGIHAPDTDGRTFVEIATLRGLRAKTNAELLAAAPEMLAALREIADIPGGTIGSALTLAKEIARAAIAQAEGRANG